MSGAAMPYAGGISITDNTGRESNAECCNSLALEIDHRLTKVISPPFQSSVSSPNISAILLVIHVGVGSHDSQCDAGRTN